MKCRKQTPGGMCALLWAAFLLVALAGCGGSDRVTVTGTLTRHDGTPLVEGRVTARSSGTGISASAVTDANGHFDLGTSEGKGLPPGEYYVLVIENPEAVGAPQTISPKYRSPSSSGLTMSVKAGEPTELNVTLDPP